MSQIFRLNFFLHFPILFLFFSCSNITIKAKQQFPISLNQVENHRLDFHFDVNTESYLWGLLPTEKELDVSSHLQEKGIFSVAALTIKKKSSTINFLWSFFTLGFYLPQAWEISGKSPL